MKPSSQQYGAAAIELVFVMLGLLAILAPLVLFGRLYWYYSVLKSSSLQGARIVAAAPPYIFANTSTRNALLQAASQTTEDAAIASGLPRNEVIGNALILCDGGVCGWPLAPQRVQARFRMALSHNLMLNLMQSYLPPDGYYIEVQTELAYAGKLPLDASVAP